MKTRDEKIPGDPPPKRPYRRPTLTRYGDIRAITRAVGFQGAADGGAMLLMRKTR